MRSPSVHDAVATPTLQRLVPYVSQLAAQWVAEADDRPYRRVDGTLVFADISGFTGLTERLAGSGKQGAEELSDTLNGVFTNILDAAYAEGGWLVKWGGDAVLVMYDGPEHAVRAARAAFGMRSALRRCGSAQTSAGRVRLRMSAGVHSGPVDFLLVGSRHRELLVTGPTASEVGRLEALAAAGQIAISETTASRLPGRCLGAAVAAGFLLRAAPATTHRVAPRASPVGPGLVQLLSEPLRRHVSDPGAEHEAHRRVAVGFAEFRGTDVLATTDPDLLSVLLARLTDAAQEAAHAYGVTFLESDFGRDSGKLMFVAGAPRSTTDVAEAMVRTMHRLVTTDVSPLTVSAGVTAGRAFTALVGPPYRRCYSVKGDVVNLAARLMASAAPGELRAASNVPDLCRCTITTTPLEPFRVKGKARAVDAVVIAALGRDRRSAPHGLRFVGRRAELTALTAALASARQGRGRAVAVLGEAGSGKTRLLRELGAGVEGLTRLSVCADRFEATTPYSTVQRLLGSAWTANAGEGAVPRDVASLTEWTVRAAPDLLPWLPMLGAACGISVPETPQVTQLDPRFRTAQVAATVSRTLAALLPGEAVICIDDAHELDDASAQVLQRVGTDAEERPWLLVVAGRHAGPSALKDCTTLQLAPLESVDVRQLVELATEADPWPPHVVAAVVDRVAGSPGFLDELLRMTATARDGGELPASAEAAVAAQLEALSPHERDVLRVAAVLGARFHASALAALAAEPHVDEALRALSAAGLLVAEDEGRWRFRNALVRDTAYEALPYRRRVALHAAVADQLTGVADVDHDAVLAQHLFRARRFAAALTTAAAAARVATARYADAEAAELYQLALVCSSRLATAPDGDVVEEPSPSQLEEWLGDARTKLGLLQPAAAAYLRARRSDPGDPVTAGRLCLKLSFVNERLGRYPTALRWQSRGLHVVADETTPSQGRWPTSAGALDSLRPELLMRRAFVCFEQGRYGRAARVCDLVVEHAEQCGRTDVLGQAYQLLDALDVATGCSSREPWAVRALEIFQGLDDPMWQGKVLNQLGVRAHLSGRWDDARAWYQQGRDALIRAGDVGSAAVASANLAELLCDQGHTREAADALGASLRVWRASRAASHLAFGMAQLGRVRGRMADHGEALRLLGAAYDELVREGLSELALDALSWRAEVLLSAGETVSALAVAREALTRLSGGASAQAPLLHRLVGEALAAHGDVVGARAAYAESVVAARDRQAWHEVAFTLSAIIALDRASGVTPSDAAVDERNALATQLGLVSLPSQRPSRDDQVMMRGSPAGASTVR